MQIQTTLRGAASGLLEAEGAFTTLWPGTRRALTMACLAGAALLAACGGDGGGGDATAAPSTSTSARFAATKVTLEPAGANCAFGGSRIESGIDSNNNGQLDVAEVSGVQYACNGTPGAAGSVGATSLLRTDAEPAGANCAAGGTRIRTGLDANGNGTLDSGEVSGTSYVCAGANGAPGANGVPGANGGPGVNGSNGISSLMVIANENAGAHCPHGGKRVTSGADSNGNSVLDAGEVTATDYVCNGAPGPGISWTVVTSTTQQAAANAGYVASHAAQPVVITLPASPNVGDIVQVTGAGNGGWALANNAGQTVITKRLLARYTNPAQRWVQTGGSVTGWWRVAGDEGGSRLVAVTAPGHIHTSADYGATWTQRSPSGNWTSVAASRYFGTLAALAFDGTSYSLAVSVDSGLNWTVTTPPVGLRSIAVTPNGSRLYAVTVGGELHTSGDNGVTWACLESASVCLSGIQGVKVRPSHGTVYALGSTGIWWGDGAGPLSPLAGNPGATTHIALAVGPYFAAINRGTVGPIQVSADSGATWAAAASSKGWTSIDASYDGDLMLAGTFGDKLAVSRDFGVTWVEKDAPRQWSAVHLSGSGERRVAIGDGLMFTSEDDRTTPGTTGRLRGAKYDAVKVQYLGDGEWIVLEHNSHSGLFTVD